MTLAWENVELIDDRAGNQFKAIVRRLVQQTQPIPRDQSSPALEVTPEVTPEVFNMLSIIKGEMSRNEIMAALALKDEKHFREHYQQRGIELGLIEMTIPDKPCSSKQRYRLTQLGKALVAE